MRCRPDGSSQIGNRVALCFRPVSDEVIDLSDMLIRVEVVAVWEAALQARVVHRWDGDLDECLPLLQEGFGDEADIPLGYSQTSKSRRGLFDVKIA